MFHFWYEYKNSYWLVWYAPFFSLKLMLNISPFICMHCTVGKWCKWMQNVCDGIGAIAEIKSEIRANDGWMRDWDGTWNEVVGCHFDEKCWSAKIIGMQYVKALTKSQIQERQRKTWNTLFFSIWLWFKKKKENIYRLGSNEIFKFQAVDFIFWQQRIFWCPTFSSTQTKASSKSR